MERRKKAAEESGGGGTTVGGRVEVTRVNPDSLIDELLRSTNLEHHDDSAESEYLLFLALFVMSLQIFHHCHQQFFFHLLQHRDYSCLLLKMEPLLLVAMKSKVKCLLVYLNKLSWRRIDNITMQADTV